ncbi:MAG TPA: NfeD family protein [Cyclobacteriaceae bacterium]|jgi:membrane-bound serine protease (ClpP class)|nr:nodulation protein NfeD [Cytophagales bacterium]HRE67874.1 NfeD family protein [Cyclobacteriaceae bacterium]HRF33844.1 NfeD family protein [Cyclobacteriaceae bacterium]
MRTLLRIMSIVLLVQTIGWAQPAKKKVMVMEIKAEIDPRIGRYVKLALEHADKTQADIIVVDMDTFGGALSDTKEIVDQIMALKIPIWVFINSDAASAGALISIACDSIYMAPGATIGAATVVDGSGAAAPDKYQSYMRSIMRATAEENGRNPRIAEGMVDENVVIDSLKQAGKVITFTTSEAMENGYCEAKVESIDEILKRNNVGEYEIETFRLGAVEKIIAIFLNPFISGILILVIMGGIYFELQTPGVGFPLLAAIVALVLYLVPYYLNGLAAYWEILALFIGVLLIIAELFFIPGFGIAGISGITLTVVSLVLIMLNNDFFNFEFVPLGDIIMASFAAVGGLAGGVILLFVGGARLTKTRAFARIALTDTQDAKSGYTVSSFQKDLMGKRGKTQTILRPSGKVLIEGQVYDAFTRGDFIEKDETIEVIGTEGVTLRVKKVE